MGAFVADHMIKAGFQMLHQGACIRGVGVIGNLFIQDFEITGLLQVSRGSRDQPKGIVVEPPAYLVVALLGERLELVIAPAVPELGRRDIQDALPCPVRRLVDKAQQILRAVAEAQTAADAAFKQRRAAGHVESDHALIRVPDIDHAGELFVAA